MASRVLGVVRETLLARLFGANWLTDAYVVAFRIPNLLRDLFAEGALSGAFVPTFTEALTREGKERAYRVANLVLGGALLVTSALVLVGMIFSQPITALMADFGAATKDPGEALHRLSFAATLARIMMPILALISASAVFMGMLNAQKRYLAPAYAPAVFNVVSILSGLVIYATGMGGERGLVVWSAGTLLAGAVQCLCQLPGLWRLGFRPRPALAGVWRDPAVRRIVRLMAPATVGLAAIQVNVFVNTHFATLLGEGPVSCMQYAFRLFYLPVGVFGVALGTITTTRVAHEAARGDRAALEERTLEGSRAVWMLASASSVGLIILAEPVLMVLFEGRKFTVAATHATTPILQAYMLGVLPYSLVKIFAPAFYTLDHPRRPMVASMLAVAANLVFNALTYRRLGAQGLALGTTLAALVNLGVLRASFGRLMGTKPRPGRAREIGVLAIANALMGVVVWGLWRQGSALLAGPGGRLTSLPAAGLLLVTIAAGFVVYALLVRALRYPGGEELLALPSRLLRKLRR
jgi:putative peptidoglycan lipid II flippase